VCEQLVSTVPELVPADEFEKARGAHAKLTARLTAAQTAHAKLITTLAKAESTLDHLVGERNELAATLEGAPSLVEVDAELERATLRQKALERAMETVKIGESAQSAAERAMKELAATERKLRAQFHSTRDALAALDPPSIGEAGVLADWQVLVEWGSTAGDHVEKELGELVTQRDSLRKRRVELVATVEDACARLGIDGTQPRVLEHLAVEATKCDAEADRVRETLARIQQLRTQADAKRAEQQVAEELGRLLGASGFQQWLLEEALDELVDGASARLEQLSSGQFSLERRERDFMVRDHRNADELRSVRTLSGGETFLASLSLALALADNVAALSAEGAPKLESIFLDEGFGTLDAETLEVVAAAIEELGASGRMVGIVTHIHELAERLPTRFEVSKGPSTSTVERVER
jgi:exonuclease SbcC